MKSFLVFITIFLSFAGSSWALECRRGASGEAVSLETLAEEVPQGSTLFLGELHGFEQVASGQVQILEELRRQGHKIDMGLEFFTYTKQTFVDQFLQGLISENTFLENIGWASSMDFSFYRRQALFPNTKAGESTWAINAPLALTRAVAQRGLESLSEAEKALLPPNLELGRSEYFERFKRSMGGHVDEKNLFRYFQAQSVWDETMAWQLLERQNAHTQAVVVGEFHVQYGGGLPHRLSVRAPHRKIVTVGFMDIHDLSPEEISEALAPHATWGVREDFICLVDLPQSSRRWSLFKGLGKTYR